MTAKEELAKWGISEVRNRERLDKLGMEDVDRKLGLDVSLLVELCSKNCLQIVICVYKLEVIIHIGRGKVGGLERNL